MLAVIAMFWMLGPAGRYLFRHGDVARAHADALADSIAVKITGDPAGLKKLMGKLAAGMMEMDLTLELQIVSRYLFLCPLGAEAGDGERVEGNGAEEPLQDDPYYGGKLAYERAFRGVIKKTMEYASRSYDMRIENLEMIERGSWPLFEPRG